ncbi:MAG TPA: hypothetical protein VFE47_00175 [Tepidisphaeraceae bacterium]|jgi:hypothetical protein|nr:hypothetical protein [Tepidisphaeraceae bacterium]
MRQNAMWTLLFVLLAVIGVEMARAIRRPPPAAPSPVQNQADETAELALLDRKIDRLSLENATLKQAVEALQTKTGVPIEVDWTDLEKWRDMQVDLELHGARLGDVIAFLFSLHRSRTYQCSQADFAAVDGKVLITGSKVLPVTAMYERVYDVRDLLSDEYWGCAPGTVTGQVYDGRSTELCRLLTEQSEIRNWKAVNVFGQMDGTATYLDFGGRLFITQTAYNHRRVRSVLKRLRIGEDSQMPRVSFDRRIARLDFNDAPFMHAVRAIADGAAANIIVEEPDPAWHDDTSPQPPITLALRNTTLEDALNALMTKSHGLSFNDSGGGIIGISSDPDSGSMQVIDARLLARAAGKPLRGVGAPSFYINSYGETASGKALHDALAVFFPTDINPDTAVFFGTRFTTRNDVSFDKQIRNAIDALAHPSTLTSALSDAPAKEPFRLQHFECDNVPPAVAANELRKAFGANVNWRLNSPIGNPDRRVSLEFDNASPKQVAATIMEYEEFGHEVVASAEDGVLCIDRNDEDDPKIFRAFDIAGVLKGYRTWYRDNGILPTGEPSDEDIVRLLSDWIGSDNPSACWNGRLLVLATPLRQRRLFFILRDLQAGKPLPENGFR